GPCVLLVFVVVLPAFPAFVLAALLTLGLALGGRAAFGIALFPEVEELEVVEDFLFGERLIGSGTEFAEQFVGIHVAGRGPGGRGGRRGLALRRLAAGALVAGIAGIAGVVGVGGGDVRAAQFGLQGLDRVDGVGGVAVHSAQRSVRFLARSCRILHIRA